MTSRDFAFWLQGFFEIEDPFEIGPEQTEMIKKHLSLVFIHEIDPSMGGQEHQDKLNGVHNKPTLEELGQKYGFEVSDEKRPPKPHPDYEWHLLYKTWYDPKQGVPRC